MSPKSHLNVYVRIRPLSVAEGIQQKTLGPFDAEVASRVFTKDNSRTTSVLQDNIIIFDPAVGDGKKPIYSTRRRKEIKYGFDYVFSEQASQSEVYQTTAMPLIDTVLDGYNATLFAYGATGCGKTHTIVGSEGEPGVIYRTMKDLYLKLEEKKNETLFDVSLSYLEVYNETIRDLLEPGTEASLDLREDESHIVVSGLSSHSPSCADEILEMLVKGNENRTRAHTESNAVSSRSHAVLQVRIRQRSKIKGISTIWTEAMLSIIDLAGSERASATKNRGDRLIEGANINRYVPICNYNRSLLALGNCINALSQGRKAHIPYRDSKLTRLLKHSLSGNCQVVMIANISPSVIHAEETHNTLKYANRAKNIRITLDKNQIDVDYHISQYPVIVAQLQAEIEQLKKGDTKIELSETGQYILGKIKSLLQKIKSKECEKLDIYAKLQWNEWRIDHLNALSMATESLDDENVKFRHNQSELTVAIERYTGLVRNYLKKAQDTLPGSSCEYLEKEERLESLMVRFETKEYECKLLQSQSLKLSRIITDLLNSKMSEILKQEESNAELLYDTCTDDSESDIDHQNLNDENEDVFYTPKKNESTDNDQATIKANKFTVPLDTTPSLKKRLVSPEAVQHSPVIKKMKKRRESMIPTISKRPGLASPPRLKTDASPRRSRRLSKLPMTGRGFPRKPSDEKSAPKPQK